MIPKVIHYCWFGGGEKPADMKMCIESWSILSDYQVIEWNETNCSFDENEYIKRAYAEKRWAFISDFYRLKALYEMGGIYLDTDVKVCKSFDKLLQNEVFINFIFDCSIGTAIIGATKKSKLIEQLLKMYNNTYFTNEDIGKVIYEKENKYFIRDFVPNNYIFTYYIIKNYPKFKLNNKYQELGDFTIYPKELLEIGSYIGKHYAIHLCTGSWKKTLDSSNNSSIKYILSHIPWLYNYLQIVVRHKRYKARNKSIPFYPQYIAQKRNEELPPL